MIRISIDPKTVEGLIGSNKAEMKRYGTEGNNYVEICGLHFSRGSCDGSIDPWTKDIHESLSEVLPLPEDLPVQRISVHVQFIAHPRRDRGAYKLGTASAELEVNTHLNSNGNHELKMIAEGGKPNEMLTHLKELELAIKTGNLDEVIMTHSFENDQVTEADFKAPPGMFRIIHEHKDGELEIVADFERLNFAKTSLSALREQNEDDFFTLCDNKGKIEE